MTAGIVVQQNSATSEQSAAASAEMNGQAGALEQLISTFKLRGSQHGHSYAKSHSSVYADASYLPDAEKY